MASSSFTRPQANETPYTSASLMRATWESNDEIQDGVDSDIENIKGILIETYKFQDVLWRMPYTTTTADVIAYINQHASSKGSKHLFVFYYSGHGGRKGNPNSKLLLKTEYKDCKELVYDDIHRALYSLRCDVLVILDCCRITSIVSLYPKPDETRSDGRKKMVFIGACAASEVSMGRSDLTLTYRLCKATKAVNGWPVSLCVILGELNYETTQARKSVSEQVWPDVHFADIDDSSPKEGRDMFLHRIPGA
ncbi:hypothetical protein QBC37DRAFT_406121 [Rhypophila decipiens]|uniref:Peptidase C14 caspase domain-containing protein n=1 Tax=Rhypophila decipiens TaxID=261697 RepID=A0AAN6Y1F0_9PEZI|nr:hypothetical protein QBC37DRAFT_406121 [Rhypophila decipiens]